MSKMTGGRFIAETFHGYGITHVFFMPVIIPRALLEMETLGIKRIMAHGEKAAAYMADAYARVSRRAGICMAQSVGAANLAAGLQDAYPRVRQSSNSTSTLQNWAAPFRSHWGCRAMPKLPCAR